MTLIDPQRLAALTDGNGNAQGPVLAAFSQASESDRALLHQAAAAGDLLQAEMLAHRIKGACVTLGAIAYAEGCSLVALACRSGDARELAESLRFLDRQAVDLESCIAALQGAQAAPIREAAPEGPTAESSLCAGLRFMVVDDHPFQLGVAVRHLQRLGADAVEGFGDSTAAFKAMIDPGQAAHIVILDMSMPGMDGMDVMRTLNGTQHSFSLILNSALSPSLVASLLQMARHYKIRLLGAIDKPLTHARLAPLIAAYRAQHAGSAAASPVR